jgi:hypothetical protein
MESDYKSNTMSFSKSRQTPNLLRIVFTITSRIVGVPTILLTSRIVGECSYSIRSRIIGSVFEHLFTSSAPIQDTPWTVIIAAADDDDSLPPLPLPA